MSFEADLGKGVGLYLAAGGIGVWRDSGRYSPDETALFYGIVPDKPAQAITVTPYPLGDDPTLSDSRYGVQLRVRGGTRDRRSCDNLADAIFSRMHGLHRERLETGVMVVQSLRSSSVSLGQGSDGLWARTENYYLDVHRLSAHRT